MHQRTTVSLDHQQYQLLKDYCIANNLTIKKHLGKLIERNISTDYFRKPITLSKEDYDVLLEEFNHVGDDLFLKGYLILDGHVIRIDENPTHIYGGEKSRDLFYRIR